MAVEAALLIHIIVVGVGGITGDHDHRLILNLGRFNLDLVADELLQAAVGVVETKNILYGGKG